MDAGYDWIRGHIMFDRDINDSNGRDYGIAVGEAGVLGFGGPERVGQRPHSVHERA